MLETKYQGGDGNLDQFDESTARLGADMAA
jgi:hypothetical protein